MNMIEMVILFFLTFFATVLFTYFVRMTLRDADISDSPIVSEHRHKAGTPTMGGIAFLFAILFVVCLYYRNTHVLVLSLIMITGGVMGMLDDLLGLRVKEYHRPPMSPPSKGRGRAGATPQALQVRQALSSW